MDDILKLLLKLGIGLFVVVCFLIWGLQSGHTFLYFVVFAFVVYILVGAVTKNGKLAILALLLVLVWYALKYDSIDNALQRAGRQLPHKISDQASKNADKYIQSKDPYGDIRGAVNTSTKLDQNQINQCMRDVVAKYSSTDPSIARNAQVCAQMTGKQFQTCMETHAFTADANQSAVIDAVGCSGASENPQPSSAEKLGNLGKAAGLIVACKLAELVNYLPWMNIDTSKCPN